MSQRTYDPGMDMDPAFPHEFGRDEPYVPGASTHRYRTHRFHDRAVVDPGAKLFHTGYVNNDWLNGNVGRRGDGFLEQFSTERTSWGRKEKIGYTRTYGAGGGALPTHTRKDLKKEFKAIIKQSRTHKSIDDTMYESYSSSNPTVGGSSMDGAWPKHRYERNKRPPSVGPPQLPSQQEPPREFERPTYTFTAAPSAYRPRPNNTPLPRNM